MSVLDDEFIESIISTEPETTNPSETMEIERQFYGMEAVAQFSQTPKEAYNNETDSNGGDGK